jgi:hypothetical protein
VRADRLAAAGAGGFHGPDPQRDLLVGLLTLLLIFNPRSDLHYHQRPDRRDLKTPATRDRSAAEHVLRDGGVAFWT